MPEIMSLFIFQASRRQILAQLHSAYHDAAEQRADQTDGAAEAHEATERHADNLQEAIKAAQKQVQALEYWSDMKDMARLIDSDEAADQGLGEGNRKGGEDREES